MTCCTKQPSSCRFSSDSCDCCVQDVIQQCPAVYNHQHRHHTDACTCVHPIIICACSSCSSSSSEGGQAPCHHGHPSSPTPPNAEKPTE